MHSRNDSECDVATIAMFPFLPPPSIVAWTTAAWIWQLHCAIEHATGSKKVVSDRTRSLRFPDILSVICHPLDIVAGHHFMRFHLVVGGVSHATSEHIYQHKKGIFSFSSISARPSRSISIPIEVIFYHLIREICKCHLMFIAHVAYTVCVCDAVEWMNHWLNMNTIKRPNIINLLTRRTTQSEEIGKNAALIDLFVSSFACTVATRHTTLDQVPCEFALHCVLQFIKCKERIRIRPY